MLKRRAPSSTSSVSSLIGDEHDALIATLQPPQLKCWVSFARAGIEEFCRVLAVEEDLPIYNALRNSVGVMPTIRRKT